MTLLLTMSIILIASMNDKVSMWFSMEINSILFLMMMMKSSTNMSKSPSLTYLIASFLSSLTFMYSFTTKNNLMMEISLLMKMGVPPFQYWMMIAMEEISNKTMWILTGLQKLPPLILSFTFMKSGIINITIILSLFYIATSFLKFSSLKKILFTSSISTSAMTLILSTLSPYICLILMTFYTWNMMMLTHSMEMKNMENHSNNPEVYLLMMNFSGIPPLPIFWAKVLMVKTMITSQPMITILTIMTMISMMMFLYLKNTVMKTLTNKYSKHISLKELTTLMMPILML